MRNGTGTTKAKLLIGGFVAALALTAPTTASAGLLFTGSGSDCDPLVSQVFQPWGDDAYYRLAPGGSFEGSHGWSLSRGAKVVNGNERFYVRSRSDNRSLYLPDGAVATSPTMCFSFGDWHSRLFVRKAGSGSGSVEVDILVRNLLGLLSVLDGGTITADGTWDPSPEMSALVSNVGALLGLSQAVSIRLRARNTDFQVDDVYLDPFKSG